MIYRMDNHCYCGNQLHDILHTDYRDSRSSIDIQPDYFPHNIPNLNRMDFQLYMD